MEDKKKKIVNVATIETVGSTGFNNSSGSESSRSSSSNNSSIGSSYTLIRNVGVHKTQANAPLHSKQIFKTIDAQLGRVMHV